MVVVAFMACSQVSLIFMGVPRTFFSRVRPFFDGQTESKMEGEYCHPTEKNETFSSVVGKVQKL